MFKDSVKSESVGCKTLNPHRICSHLSWVRWEVKLFLVVVHTCYPCQVRAVNDLKTEQLLACWYQRRLFAKWHSHLTASAVKQLRAWMGWVKKVPCCGAPGAQEGSNWNMLLHSILYIWHRITLGGVCEIGFKLLGRWWHMNVSMISCASESGLMVNWTALRWHKVPTPFVHSRFILAM